MNLPNKSSFQTASAVKAVTLRSNARPLLRSVVGIIFSVLWTAAAANADELVGPVSVVNAGMLNIGAEEIRLMGVDAPDLAQICWDAKSEPWNCGQQAAMALTTKTKGSALRCRGTRRDQSGRLLAICELGVVNINAWLVAEGWALANRHQSLTFVAAEDAARESAKGIWMGAFEPPSVWRTKHQADTLP